MAPDLQVIHELADLEESLASVALENDSAGISTASSDIDDLEASLISNSTEVSPRTEKEYVRLMRKISVWLEANGHLQPGDTPFGQSVDPKMPLWIISWIMSQSDTKNPDGTEKTSTEYRCSWTYAMKMRAALTYGFGRDYERGNLPWTKRGEVWEGNPSTSNFVSRYMTALRRRKYMAGEKAISSKALTSDVIRDIFNFNKQMNHTSESWGGHRSRSLVHAVVTLAFVCLLRIDEVLNLRSEDIEVLSPTSISITLPSRKTNPFGGIKPYVLHLFDEDEKHLCPVRAIAEWIRASEFKGGYLFRSIKSMDQVSVRNTPTSQPQFLEMFRNNLHMRLRPSIVMAGNSLKRRTISVFGNRCCGKSSLVLQFIENIFIEPYYPTIENIFVKTVNHMGTQYQCEIIDTAGLDEYSLLNPKHIIGVHGFILVYSVASRNSFDMVQVVYDKIIDFCGTTDIPCVIAGSKTDLQANRQVEPSEGEQLAQVNKAAWIETSAKENVSVAKAFDLCLAEIEKWTLNSQPEPVERRCVIM